MYKKSSFWSVLGLIVVLLGCSNDDERPMTAKSSHRYTEAIVVSADLSKDGAVSAILTDDQQVAVWDNRSQKPLAQWHKKQFDDELFVLALSGNARFLCVAGHWTVTMLNVADGSVVTVWDVQGFSHSATVSALHVDETASKVLVGMSDGAVLSVNLKTGNALKLDHHRLKVTRLSYDVS
ncbi:MAG: WD40 repeat protein, partial [Phenylobacterium sp.]